MGQPPRQQKPRNGHKRSTPPNLDFALGSEDIDDESAEALRGFLLGLYTRKVFDAIVLRLVAVERKALLTERALSENQRHAAQAKLEVLRSLLKQLYAAIGEKQLPRHIAQWFE